MESLLLGMAALGSIAIGWLLRGFAGGYAQEKGKNLATREDVGDLTAIVESTKHEYAAQLEQTKSSLSHDVELLKQQLQLNLAASNRYENAKTEAYVDFYRAAALLAIAQRAGSADKELDANAALADAKARIAVYGSKPVTEALSRFFTEYGHLRSSPAAASFIEAVQLMRSEAVSPKDSVSESSISGLFFGQGPFAEDQTQGVKSPESPLFPSVGASEVTYSPADLVTLNALLDNTREAVLRNYEELTRNGNPPGTNTMQIAFLTYMAASLSALDRQQISILRANGVLRI